MRYMNHTSHLVLYRLKSQFIRNQITFPNVTTLSLVHCHHIGIKRILNTSIFPNLKEIHYLSTHPGEYDIYRKLSPQLKWIFPNYSFGFYDSMMEAGRGIKSDLLISNHITNFKITNHLMYFDLYLPNYCIADGYWYLSMQNMFLKEKYGNELGKNSVSLKYSKSLYQPDSIPHSTFNHYHNKNINELFMKTIMDDYHSELEMIKLVSGLDDDRV
jgi:hypothetical protein